MASKITYSTYLAVELADSSGQYTRSYRVDNPNPAITTKAQVASALAPAFAKASDELGTFFQDDATSAYLEQVKSVMKYEVRREETPLA